MKTIRIRAVCCMVAMLGVVASESAFATTASWTNTAGGAYSWTNAANWSPATFPNGQDDVAYLTNNIAGNQTIDLGQAITLGQLSIGDSDNTASFAITNTTANPLTFQTSSGSAYLIKMPNSGNNNANVRITPNITLAGNLTVSNLVANTDASPYLTLMGNIGESGGSRQLTLASVNWNGVALSGSNNYSGGTVLSFGNDPSYVAVLNPNALGTGAVTTASGRAGRVYFNLAAPGTFSQGMQLNTGNGFALYNASTNPVALNGTLSGGGPTYFWLQGVAGNGGYAFGGNNTSGSRLLPDNTSLTILTNTAINNFWFVVLTEATNHTGKVYLANGVAVTRNFYHHVYGNLTASTPVYLGMSQAGAASISGTVDLTGRNSSNDTAVSDFYLDTPSGAILTLSGVISSSSTYTTNRLVKIGAGTVAITGNSNTYGGPTIVSNGTLWVNNTSGSGTGAGSVSVATNGIVGGIGMITGAVSVAAGGTLAPGTNSAGTLTVGALALASNALFALQLGGTNIANYSQCVVTTGAVSLAGSQLSISLTGGYVPAVKDSFTIIRNNSGAPVSGAFAKDTAIRVPGVEGLFVVIYNGGAGDDVVLRYDGINGTCVSFQ